MNQDQQGDQAVQAIAGWMRHVDQDGYYGGEPGAVHALRDARDLYRSVVAPLLADREAELADLKWLHAEARHELDQYELLTPQLCDRGKHPEWLVDSEHNILCPWCQIEDAEASRRDWAAEADRLDTALVAIAEHCEELSAKADVQIGQIAGADLAWAAWGKAAQWLKHARSQDPCSRPQCSVHPGRESGEVGHG